MDETANHPVTAPAAAADAGAAEDALTTTVRALVPTDPSQRRRAFSGLLRALLHREER